MFSFAQNESIRPCWVSEISGSGGMMVGKHGDEDGGHGAWIYCAGGFLPLFIVCSWTKKREAA